MNLVLAAVLLLLAILTAFLLQESWFAGMAVGVLVFVPFCFCASLLFARLFGLDKQIGPDNAPTTTPTESSPLEQ